MSAHAPPDADRGPDAHRPSVAELIHRRLDQLTPTERKPARLLLANYPVVGLEPLAGFARRAEVSHPSVLRFIAKLGFSNYADFQSALRAELAARFESLLGDAQNTLYLAGGRFTDQVATYAYMHLRVLRPRVHHVSGPPVSWSEYVLDMDRRAVLLVFDIRRYQDDLLRFAREAAGRGARIVLVTDQWLSPIASEAEHVLSTRIEVPSSWDSVVAMTTLIEALIAALNNRKWSRLKGRIRELERMRTHFETDEGAGITPGGSAGG